MIKKTVYALPIVIAIIIASSCALLNRKTSQTPEITTAANDDKIAIDASVGSDKLEAPTVAPKNNPTAKKEVSANRKHNYGTYLAGRVAHIRHDLNKAADYYMVVSDNVPEKQMLPNQLYIMLTSQGRIDEAVKYAEIAQKKGDPSPFIYTITAINQTKQKKYQEAIDTISKCDNPFAKSIFNPLIAAWNYAGLGDAKQALKALEPLQENPPLRAIYLFNAGAINDYLGNNKAAAAHYAALLKIKHMELAVFPLQVINNFYIRNQEPDKAMAAANMAVNKNNLMMTTILNDIKKMDTSTTPILSSPDIGISDALFSISLLLQQDNSNNSDLSMLFASLSSYANPNYPLPHMLTADILEKKELFSEANLAYNKIPSDSYAYYTAQFQIGKNLLRLNKAEEAKKVFLRLYDEYPPNPDIFTNLGEVARINQKYDEAAQYYQKAIDGYPENYRNELWPLYFAIGISYGAAGNNDLAEQYLRKVLEIKPNRMTQNHLAYILLQQNKNIEEAFELIVSAYNSSSDEGTITDSLGWAFYKIGNYNQAIKYLEKASDQSPSETIIYDHLGDAYWQNGRKREAEFQWNHALGLKDETGEFDREKTLQKLQSGLEKPIIPTFDSAKVEEQIKKLKQKEEN